MNQNKNLACRIFKEQIDLIQQLPENERAEVLYKAILSAFNQFENQNENQFENQFDIQNENAYVSVSVSDSVSVLGKIVFSLLEKNIVCKEFSNNYGGKRTGAGRPEKTKNQYSGQSGQSGQKPIQTQTETETETETKRDSIEKKTTKQIRGAFVPPTLEEVLEYAKDMNDHRGVGGFTCSRQTATDFFNQYDRQGWILGNGNHMSNWKSGLRLWANKEEKNILG